MKVSPGVRGLLVASLPLAGCNGLPARPSTAILPLPRTESTPKPAPTRTIPAGTTDPVETCFETARRIARQKPDGAIGYCDQGDGTTLIIGIDHQGNVTGSRVSRSQLLQP
jgi:hypothetical protein